MPKPISKSRLVVFYTLSLVIPVLFFVLLEVGLRYFDYGDNLDLFVDAAEQYGNEPYLVTNNVVSYRYFPKNKYFPQPSQEYFRKEKPENGYRVFVMGGSTAASWPYPKNVLFSRILAQRLSDAFPDKYIEVVNTGIAAVNSFTLLDFVDEVIAQKPDAVLIYAGHNEFYGALGAGSTQSIGQSRWLIKLYLYLAKYKTVQLIRDGISYVRSSASQGDQGSTHPTLMGQMIDDSSIAYGSEKYTQAVRNFEANLGEILSKLTQANIQVLTSELISNLKDHPPFISIQSEGNLPADLIFHWAQLLEKEGMYDMARQTYIWAKDQDGLRFRASEDINESIRTISSQYKVPVIPMKSYFEKASPNGLIGSNLILEHLHPNVEGYFLMSEAFFDYMKQYHFISDKWDDRNILPSEYYRRVWPITDYDRALGRIRILNLTSYYPFKPKGEGEVSFESFVPTNLVDKLALDAFKDDKEYVLGHLKLASYYDNMGQDTLAYRELLALISAAPFLINGYMIAGEYLLKHERYDEAFDLFLASLSITETGYALKWIGQIYMLRNQPANAQPYLEKALNYSPDDIQIIYSLGIASAVLGNIDSARQSLKMVENMDPTSTQALNLKRFIDEQEELDK